MNMGLPVVLELEHANKVAACLDAEVQVKMRLGATTLAHMLAITAGCATVTPDRTPRESDPLARVSEAFETIVREYVEPVEETKLVAGCRQRMLKHVGQSPDSSGQAPMDPVAFTPSLERIREAFNAIKRSQADAAEERKLANACVEGMVAELEGLEARHRSEFLDEEALNELQVGSMPLGGVGLEIGISGGQLKIVSPIEGAPADKADLRRNDILERIDDIPTKGLSLKETVKLLRGRPGSTVKITIVREGTSGPIELTLTRQVIKYQSRWKWAEPAYLHIRISSFLNTTVQELASMLQSSFRESHGELKGLILDLRHNTGGLLNACVGVAAAFLPPEALVTETKGRTKDRSMRLHARPTDYLPRRGPDPLKELSGIFKTVPMVVLVNGKSAACSEIVAAALMDHKRATVVGSRTFGYGTVQTIFPLKGGVALKLSTARFFRPGGKPIDSVGVVPDAILGETEEVLPRFDSVSDDQLSRALQVLQSKSP